MYISLLTALQRWTTAGLGFWRSTPIGLCFNLPILPYPFTAASQLLQRSYTCVCVCACGGTKECSSRSPTSPCPLSNYPPPPELWLLKSRRWLLRVVVASALTVTRVVGESKSFWRVKGNQSWFHSSFLVSTLQARFVLKRYELGSDSGHLLITDWIYVKDIFVLVNYE